jgi:hypothetical protein
MKYLFIPLILFTFTLLNAQELTYPIVDTGVTEFYDNDSPIKKPEEGQAFYGQDGQYREISPPMWIMETELLPIWLHN